MRIYEHFGYSLPRTSAAQAGATRTVSSGDVRPGDLFFYGSGGVSHVAMYIGNGQIIHASNPRTGIKIFIGLLPYTDQDRTRDQLKGRMLPVWQ